MKNAPTFTDEQHAFVGSMLPTLCFALQTSEEELRAQSDTLSDAVYKVCKQAFSKARPRIEEVAPLMLVCFWLRQSHLAPYIDKLIRNNRVLRTKYQLKCLLPRETFIRYDLALLSILHDQREDADLSTLVLQMEWIKVVQNGTLCSS